MVYADACDRIMTLLRTLSWVQQAPNDPPGAAIQFPFAALFPGTGRSERVAEVRRDVHTVNLEVHWAFRDLPRNAGDAKDRLDSLLNLFWSDITLNGTVDCITAIDYEFGPMSWGSVESLGYIMRVSFKQKTAVT